ncbi:MAG: hypothetical protein J4G12_04400 [Gemmatimonadetes bacterium]|nr:hypothetical protein [Gemmatimonadota bacterium]
MSKTAITRTEKKTDWAVTVDRTVGREFRGLPSKGLKRRILGGIIMAFNAVSLAAGFLTGGGVFWLLAGAGLFWWGHTSLRNRRETIRQRVVSAILHLARATGGRLTVTDVASQLSISFKAAETTLNAMEDGVRIVSEVSTEGVIYYEFPEILHRDQMVPAFGNPTSGTNDRA